MKMSEYINEMENWNQKNRQVYSSFQGTYPDTTGIYFFQKYPHIYFFFFHSLTFL